MADSQWICSFGKKPHRPPPVEPWSFESMPKTTPLARMNNGYRLSPVHWITIPSSSPLIFLLTLGGTIIAKS